MLPGKIISRESKPSADLPERVITPHNGMEAFVDAVSSIAVNFRQSRDLAWRLLLRDTRAMYRQSLLGYLWLVLPSLGTVLIWILLNRQNLVRINTGDIPYPLFVMTGTVLWTAFNSSVMAMQGIVAEARGSLSKVNFPHEALIMTAFGKSLINSVAPVALLLPMLLFYGVGLKLQMFLFPLGFLTVMLLGSALGLVFVPIGALYGDVGHAIQLALRFGFFVTPVIYALPESGTARTLLMCNPVTFPIVTARSWLIGGEAPLVMELALVSFMSLLLLAVATVVFKVAMPHIIERLNS